MQHKKWREYNIRRQYNLWGGIVISSNGIWQLNSSKKYTFDSINLTDWSDLEF